MESVAYFFWINMQAANLTFGNWKCGQENYYRAVKFAGKTMRASKENVHGTMV